MRTLSILLMVAICASAFVVPAVMAGEMRGIWVDAFHPGLRTPEETTAVVNKAKECGFTALFVQVRKRGDVYYRSAFEPMAREVAPGYDPLADVVEKAHAAGLQVHAWVVMYEVYHDVPEITPRPGQVHLKHPEWLTKDSNGNTKLPGDRLYLDPGLPEVKQYLVGIAKEIAANYKVDGIHLDVIRYPTPSAGYGDCSVARFLKESGKQETPKADDKDWGDWRRSQVTDLVKMVRNALKKTGKGVKLSASVFANRTDAYQNRFQDWIGWLQKGLLDFAVPMAFQTDDRVYKTVMEDVLKSANGKIVYVGQGGWRLSVDQSIGQIDIARKAGAQGFVIYNYQYCSQPRDGAVTSLMDALRPK